MHRVFYRQRRNSHFTPRSSVFFAEFDIQFMVAYKKIVLQIHKCHQNLSSSPLPFTSGSLSSAFSSSCGCCCCCYFTVGFNFILISYLIFSPHIFFGVVHIKKMLINQFHIWRFTLLILFTFNIHSPFMFSLFYRL